MIDCEPNKKSIFKFIQKIYTKKFREKLRYTKNFYEKKNTSEQIFKKIKLELPIIFLNIGGIANISYININEKITSFDVGPGNCLIDQWICQNINKDFDISSDIPLKYLSQNSLFCDASVKCINVNFEV
mgnify:CR=1 FL=1